MSTPEQAAARRLLGNRSLPGHRHRKPSPSAIVGRQQPRAPAGKDRLRLLQLAGTHVAYVNPAAEAVWGYSREEFLGMPDPFHLIASEFRDAVRGNAEWRLRGEPVPSRYEFTIFTRRREVRWLNARFTLIQYGGKPAILGTVWDIAERKRAEIALRLQRTTLPRPGRVFLRHDPSRR